MQNLVVTIGQHRYRVERSWGRLPNHLRLRDLSKVAVDSQNNVWALQRSDPPVVVFDSAGTFVRSWGQDAIVDGHGIFIDAKDRVLIVDRDAHQVLIFTTAGQLIGSLGERNNPKFGAPFSHPTDVAVAPNGDIYVTDGYGNTMVHWFTSAGQFRKSWGGRGSGPGKFATPHGIWILPDSRVLVGDRENNRVQIFSPQGEYVGQLSDLYHPMDVYVDHRGLIYVTEQIPRLTVVGQDGTIIGSCKPTPTNNHGVRGDAHGNIYLVERRISALTRLVPLDD